MPSFLVERLPLTPTDRRGRIELHHVVIAVVIVVTVAMYAHMILRYGQAVAVADGHMYYAHAHSWYFDGDCDYANNLESNIELEARSFYMRERSGSGRVLNMFPCGWSVLAMPFVALADVLTILHNAVFATDFARDGYTIYYRVVVPIGHVLVGLAGLLAAYALVSRYFSKTTAAVAMALTWLGTNVGYFIGVEPTMSHAASLGFVSLMIFTAEGIHRAGWSLGRALGLGVCCGMMMAMRHQNIAWMFVPAVLLGIPLIRALFRREPGSWRQLGATVIAALTACVCLLPQVAVNQATFGSVFSGMTKYTPFWFNPEPYRDLFEFPTGLVVLYPLAGLSLIGLVGLVWRCRRNPLIRAVAVGFMAFAYISFCAHSGTSRKYACCAVVFIFGLAAVLHWARTARWRGVLVGATVSALCVKNVMMIFLADRGFVSRYIFTAAPHDPPEMMHGLARYVAQFISSLT